MPQKKQEVAAAVREESDCPGNISFTSTVLSVTSPRGSRKVQRLGQGRLGKKSYPWIVYRSKESSGKMEDSRLNRQGLPTSQCGDQVLPAPPNTKKPKSGKQLSGGRTLLRDAVLG